MSVSGSGCPSADVVLFLGESLENEVEDAVYLFRKRGKGD